MLFGLCFLKRSYVLTSENLIRVDATHWTLDLRSLVGPSFHEVRDVCLFLPSSEGRRPISPSPLARHTPN